MFGSVPARLRLNQLAPGDQPVRSDSEATGLRRHSGPSTGCLPAWIRVADRWRWRRLRRWCRRQQHWIAKAHCERIFFLWASSKSSCTQNTTLARCTEVTWALTWARRELLTWTELLNFHFRCTFKKFFLHTVSITSNVQIWEYLHVNTDHQLGKKHLCFSTMYPRAGFVAVTVQGIQGLVS